MQPLILRLLSAPILFSYFSFAIAGEPTRDPFLRIEFGEHTAAIQSMTSDKTGRWLITASEDKTARIWSLTDGRLLNTLRVPIGSDNEGKLTAIALSPDGKIVAIAAASKLYNTSETEGANNSTLTGSGFASSNVSAIFMFDRSNGKLLSRLTELPNQVLGIAFSSDGKHLAVALQNAALRFISSSDGHLLAEASGGGNNFLRAADASSLDYSPDGRLVAAFHGLVSMYRLDGNILQEGAEVTGESIRTEIANDSPVTVKFSPDGKYVAVGYAKGNMQVFHSKDMSLAYKLDTAGVVGAWLDIAWSPKGDFIYATGTDSKHFDGKEKRYIRRWSSGERGQVVDIPIVSDSHMITGLSALPQAGVIFGSSEPSWGSINEQGKRTLFHASGIASYQDNQQNLSLSANGALISFSFEVNGQDQLTFDIQRRDFVKAQKLFSPIVNATGLNVADWKYNHTPKLNGTALMLYPDENSISMALLPNGKEFVLGTSRRLRLFESDGHKRWQQPIPSTAWAVNASLDGRFVVAAYGDGTIRWHRASDGVEQLAFFPHADRKRWIMWTPEGYYDASPGAEDLIGWHLNQGKDKEARFIPSGQLYDVFFRPDIVQAKFRGEDISSMITITAAQALKMPPPVLSFTRVPSSTKLNTEKVCYKAVATGGGIGEVRLFQNGKLIKSDGFYRETVAKVNTSMKLAAMDSATVTRALKLTKSAQNSEPPMVSNDKGSEYSECQEIETIPGDNEISVAAFNANNTIQSALETTHFTADRKAEAPHLYVLGIGINQYTATENNLTYAVKDAADFRGMIQDKAKGLFEAANIHIEGLNDAQATKAGIQQAIATISAKVKPWDSFILFVASHGYLQDNQYYIVTSDFDGAIDTSKMISSNEIVGMSKNIKSLSQLLIFDTCHAGGVDNIIGGLYDARMSVMAKKMGLHIYASAGSTQTALDGYKGNGLFTHALLDSMKANTTDSNHDSEVSVAELGERAKQETMTISTKLDFPQSPNIINFGKDNALFRVK